ncbi:response regulator transcription factor [Nitratireductor sp. GCM10026969]|uniref:response regulator transcription factor n=1 Tax=Nitratireductor sp. GCM10026969 TaxID=3252645 RepID=UPI0036176DA9
MTVHSTHTDLGTDGRPSMFHGFERTIDGSINKFDDDMHSSGEGLDEVRENVHSVALIDACILRRECLRSGLISQRVSWEIATFDSVDEWRAADLYPPATAILFHIGPQKFTSSGVADQLKELVEDFSPTPVIVFADSDDIGQIIHALDCGVRGYIPSSVSIEVCAKAINLTLAGGVFVPASSVSAMHQMVASDASHNSQLAELFTPRQIEVANAIRQGKPNKIIAYELNMCESTVKVHVRNIMKKLNATNRTEVAYRVRDLFPSESI